MGDGVLELKRLAKWLRERRDGHLYETAKNQKSARDWTSKQVVPRSVYRQLAEHNGWLAQIYSEVLERVDRRIVRLKNGTTRNRRRAA